MAVAGSGPQRSPRRRGFGRTTRRMRFRLPPGRRERSCPCVAGVPAGSHAGPAAGSLAQPPWRMMLPARFRAGVARDAIRSPGGGELVDSYVRAPLVDEVDIDVV